MLINVDLPAPLVPMTACTAPRSSRSDTAFTATSPPKRRVIPSAASSTSTMATLALAQPCRQADQSMREEQDESDDGETEQQLPALCELAEDRVVLEELLQQNERKGAEHCPPPLAEPAEDDHQEHRTGLVPREQFRIHVAVLGRLEESRQAGEHGGEHERADLVRVRRETGRAHALL